MRRNLFSKFRALTLHKPKRNPNRSSTPLRQAMKSGKYPLFVLTAKDEIANKPESVSNFPR
jgi:hypothetical protein